MRFMFICIVFRYSAFGIFGAQRAKALGYVSISESVASKRRRKTRNKQPNFGIKEGNRTSFPHRKTLLAVMSRHAKGKITQPAAPKRAARRPDRPGRLRA
jgi:hypothetical protein